MRTVFIEADIGELFMDCSTHIYYNKISERRALRRSPGGDQPDMRQEMLFTPMAEVLVKQHPSHIPNDLLPITDNSKP